VMGRDKPTSYDELFPGRFLKAGLFKGKPVTLTIKEVYRDELPTDGGGEEKRPVVAFKGTERELALNSTNAQCLRALWGDKPQEWVGHRVTLVPEQDYFGREKVDCIRVGGSPELERDQVVEIKLPRKKPKKRTLKATSNGAAERGLGEEG